MKTSMRILIAGGLLILCVPAAIVVTLLLLPLWGMIEARFGIEAVGHSGPADWCFWLVYAVLGSISLAVLFLRTPKPAGD